MLTHHDDQAKSNALYVVQPTCHVKATPSQKLHKKVLKKSTSKILTDWQKFYANYELITFLLVTSLRCGCQTKAKCT